MPRALLSVTDKSGIVPFAQGLVELEWEIVSTGGTARTLREAGLPVTEVADVTGLPEMLGGRVKTLHPKVHGGLLADLDDADHRDDLERHAIEPFGVVAVNLYAFEATVGAGADLPEAIEAIDIGGPTMIRAAAKNHRHVLVAVEPSDYRLVLDSLREGEAPGLRLRLAAKAFRHTAFYDSLVARHLSRVAGEPEMGETLTLGLRRKLPFRYGENPHQEAALYADPLAARGGIAQADLLSGKALSHNNVLDADAAWELVGDLPPGSVAIIKHANPCGAAALGDLAASYRAARAADPVSAFGGIAALHGEADAAAAAAMTEKGNFLEVVVATGFTDEARRIFAERSGWGADVRLLAAPLPGGDGRLTIRSVRGGLLVQTADDAEEPVESWRIVTARPPTDQELRAMELMWRVVRHVKSNAIVVGTGERLLGVGAGQMNRVGSVGLALAQAGDGSRGAALASDAFFPFPDSIAVAAEAGIAAIVQPGGSKKDADVIAAADRLGLTMALTGARHFRH